MTVVLGTRLDDQSSPSADRHGGATWSSTANLLADGLGRVTRVLPDDLALVTQPLGTVEGSAGPGPTPFRTLIIALGDPHHPRHADAVAALVAVGSPTLPELTAALSPTRPWLTAYRAAEALAQIGDRAATGALIGALRHPNSNVRWNVVRALADLGDPRSVWALRRIALRDRGKTSWGESVAETALLALRRLEARSPLPRMVELIATALFVAMLCGALLFAAREVRALQTELRREVPAPAWVASVVPSGTPEVLTPADGCAVTARAPAQGPAPTAVPPPPTTGRVRVPALNVRSGPWWGEERIGQVHAGDALIILGTCGDWFRVRLGDPQAVTSQIQGGEGWVARAVVVRPATLSAKTVLRP